MKINPNPKELALTIVDENYTPREMGANRAKITDSERNEPKTQVIKDLLQDSTEDPQEIWVELKMRHDGELLPAFSFMVLLHLRYILFPYPVINENFIFEIKDVLS